MSCVCVKMYPWYALEHNRATDGYIGWSILSADIGPSQIYSIVRYVNITNGVDLLTYSPLYKTSVTVEP